MAHAIRRVMYATSYRGAKICQAVKGVSTAGKRRKANVRRTEMADIDAMMIGQIT